ncbi:MAG: ribbon-helix-helix protein, CopG family [Planctomycetota bacterium]|nr:ribbon-helix-helix protein, CopG family [Planctomycetota bacterium]
MPSHVERISISLEKDLCAKLDRMVKERKAANRSEFIRDLIRGQIVEEEWKRDEEAIGAITMILKIIASKADMFLTSPEALLT